MLLSDKDFKEGIRLMPLPCVDFIVINEHDELLVGKRMNRPAQGYYFVPGGRIRKGEMQAEAMTRIGQEELGVQVKHRFLAWLGVYDHIYEDHFYGQGDGGTHCISMAWVFNVNKEWVDTTLQTQHSDWLWVPLNEVMKHPEIHDYTKDYIRDLFSGGK